MNLFGSGAILRQVLEARSILEADFDVSADVWSATSYAQLRREALRDERWNLLHPTAPPRVPWVRKVLAAAPGPIVAATDYVKLVPDQIAPFVHRPFVVLGTDGFGMSDTREALRRHFEVDAATIALAAFEALRRDGKASAGDVRRALDRLAIDPEKLDPLSV